MSAIQLRERRMAEPRPHAPERRALVIEVPPRGQGVSTRRLDRRRIWTALILYVAAFWGLVGYAIHDIVAR